MISIIKFHQSALDTIRSGTTGYFSVPRFIEVTNEVQVSSARMLANFMEDNQQVKDALATHVKSGTGNTNSSGVLAKPDSYLRFLGVDKAANKTAYPINVNEFPLFRESLIRTPSVVKGNIFYGQKDNGFVFLPEQVMAITYTYLRNPPLCALTATPVSDDDDDYETYSAPTDLDWPDEMFDFLLYGVLNKLGFDMKDQMTMQWSQLGLSMEQINTQPK